MGTQFESYRRQIPELLRFILSQKGKTIARIEQGRRRTILGDEFQAPHKDMPVWHSRTELIELLAREMRISTKYWGPQRTSADFYNSVDQEIAKLRKNGSLVAWNSTRHTGVFRLLPKYATASKPTMSLDGVSDDYPSHQDMDEGSLKQAFISILARGRKDNTYKFALARALLEHCRKTPFGSKDACQVSYEYLADRFLEYYWHQECKFRIKQDFKIKSIPMVIRAIRNTFTDPVPGDFSRIDDDKKACARRYILKTVFGSARSKTSLVVPKFQKVMKGNYAEEKKIFYDYDDDEKIVTLRPAAFEFFKNNYALLFRTVLVEWAKFLERINGSLPRLVAKIEQERVERQSLIKFRKAYEPHMDHCFYCCGKLERLATHVDHFLPWSYIFQDEAWNMVLACSRCNLKKNDSLPQDEFQRELIRRNNNYRHHIGILDSSLKIIDTRLGWKREIQNHYETCQEYGFSVIKMP